MLNTHAHTLNYSAKISNAFEVWKQLDACHRIWMHHAFNQDVWYLT